MKKTMSIIAIFAVLLLTVSANTERVFMAKEGMQLPVFELQRADGGEFTSAEIKGRFVIVNFWASTDAASRIAANRFNSYVESSREEQIGLVSVNLDTNERLFRQIVRKDGLNSESQFFAESGKISELIRKFELEKGLKSFLVDPTGKIVAVNPTVETLAGFTGK